MRWRPPSPAGTPNAHSSRQSVGTRGVQGRAHYFDQEAIENFWVAWQEEVGTGRLKVSGRRSGDGRGAQGGGPGRAQREQAVATALAALRRAGGYQRGRAARLAREHGGVPRSWQRAVTEARTLYDLQHGRERGRDQAEGAAPTVG